MGAGVAANANVLASDTPEYAMFINDAAYHANEQAEGLPSPAFLSPLWSTREQSPSPPTSGSDPDQPPQPTPESGSSRTTASSFRSYASSFAPLLRNNRNDTRLLKRTSKPSAHLGKRSSTVHPPNVPARSPSYYKPKVVEDSALTTSPTSPMSLSPSPPISLPLVSFYSPFPLRKSRSSPTNSGSGSSRPAVSPLQTLRGQHVPVSLFDDSTPLSPMSPMSPLSPLTLPRSARSEASGESRSRGSSRNQSLAIRHARDSSSDSAVSMGEKRWYPQTPPEVDPRSPSDSTPSTRSRHYFRTFSNDMIKQTEVTAHFVTAPTSPAAVEHHLRRKPSSHESPGRLNEPASSGKGKRKQSGLLGTWRASHSARSPLLTTPSSASGSSTPEIRVSSPGLAKSRRKSSISSYFTRILPETVSPAHTPSSAGSPALSTHWEDVLAESQDPQHVKEISEPMSPLSGPTRRVKPKLKRHGAVLEVPGSTKQLPGEPAPLFIPSEVVTSPPPLDQSSSRQMNSKTSVTGPSAAVNFLPSEMKRVDTPPPLKRKPTGYKGYFFDTGGTPSSDAEPETPEAGLTKRGPIVSKMSLQSLVPKLSMPKLKKKPSCFATKGPNAQPPRDPLRVTSFEQTSYSQRYGDTRRAKRTQMRTYLEEMMREDDANESATSMPFEPNVPDHLPGSPLCPLSPKHKSGGRAICPMHGRKKAVKAGSKEAGTGDSPVKERHGAPTIVFESSQRDGSGSWEGKDWWRRT